MIEKQVEWDTSVKCVLNAGPSCGDSLHLMHYSILRSSTSNMSVAFGGMTPGWPVVPYAMSGVQVSFALWPRLIYATGRRKESH